MSAFTERVVARRRALHPVRTAAVAVVALGVATGLVGLARWTATAASSQSKAGSPVGTECGTIVPATMPLPGCQRLLTSVFLGTGTGRPCGTVAPPVMPSTACQRVLERIFLGTRREAARAPVAPAVDRTPPR
jgi:hypothetical protein